MFAADRTMLRCAMKSNLMHILEQLPADVEHTTGIDTDGNIAEVDDESGESMVVVDAMAEMQSMDEPEWVKNCVDLAGHFTSRAFAAYRELRLMFDRYDVPMSLKTPTRAKRQSGQAPVIIYLYHITDSTNIAKVPLKKPLSHVNTWMELAKTLVVAWEVNVEQRTRACLSYI
jgi:hypothetical protein